MKVYDKQIGGDHYLRMKIQPSEFANKNHLPFAEGNVIKYISRHQYKGGKEDLLKAKHFIDMIIERDYETEKDEKQETSQKKWVEGYRKWKRERCPHN